MIRKITLPKKINPEELLTNYFISSHTISKQRFVHLVFDISLL